MKYIVGVKGKEFVVDTPFKDCIEFWSKIDTGLFKIVVGKRSALGVEIGKEVYIKTDRIDYIEEHEEKPIY